MPVFYLFVSKLRIFHYHIYYALILFGPVTLPTRYFFVKKINACLKIYDFIKRPCEIARYKSFKKKYNPIKMGKMKF